jgi:hypothetical protein
MNERVGDSMCICPLRWEPWLPLYRVRGQGAYKGGGSLDRRVMSLRKALANLAYKVRHLVGYVQARLSSYSYGHIMAWCGVVLTVPTVAAL